MISGSFKFRLYNQTLVNRALLDVSYSIQDHFATQRKTFNEDAEKEYLRNELVKKEAEIKMRQHLICTLAKYDIKDHVPFINGQPQVAKHMFKRQFVIQKIDDMVWEMIIKIESAKNEGKNVQDMISEYDGGNPLTNFEWQKEVFYFPLEPRKPIFGFDRSSSFFLSKKIPLRVVAKLS